MELQLFQACTDGDLSTLKDLIAMHGLNPIEVKESSGVTLLHLACKHGHLNIIQYLIKEQNYNPETTTPNGRTPLHLACKSGHLHIARSLITKYKCNPHYTDNDGYTPLHAASESANLDNVKYLITEIGCDPEVSDRVGNTPLHYASESGHLNIVQSLITDFHCDPQQPNSQGSIPLHYACCGDALPVVKYLVSEHHCSPTHTNIFGNTPVHLACLYGHLATVKYLTNECRCNPQAVNSYGLTPLHFACLNGYLHVLKFLCAHYNCNPQCCTTTGNTPLHCACQSGHLEVAKHLITEYKLNPEHGNTSGWTPLHAAASNGHLAVVKYLIVELSCNSKITDKYGRIPLLLASWKGHLDTVTFLISECNCDPQYSDKNGNTPLHHACQNGHLEVAKYLITEHKCSPEHRNMNGYTSLHLAAGNDHLTVVKYLISELGCNPPIDLAQIFGHLEIVKLVSQIPIPGITRFIYTILPRSMADICATFTPLYSACYAGNLEAVKLYIDQFTNHPSSVCIFGLNTLMCIACSMGHLGIVKHLVTECGYDPKCVDHFDNNPLHYACWNGHLEVVKYLINEHKSSPEHGDINGSTPLHSAAISGHLDVMKYLISELGCNPQIHGSNGLTPLHFASLQGHHKIVKFLISECNCNPECTDKCGNTPLHGACMNGNLEVAKYLVIEHKCDSECGNMNGSTPLHLAAIDGHLAVVKYLITELNCNPQIHDNGLTPLHIATFHGHHEIVKFLISECNCNPECTDKYGNTPLHGACMNGNLEVAKYLVNEHKCDPELGNMNGFTPLHSAASYGHLAVMKYLINELGCNPQIGDNNGLTPLHYATLSGRQNIIKFLLLDCNCSPQCCTNRGFTPLDFACQNGHLEVAKYLIIEHKCSPEPSSTNGSTPLHSAAINGHLAVVKYLISELACNPQVGNNYGNTLLHYACQNGHLEVAKYLIIAHKCSPEHSSTNGSTPLHLAAISGHLAVVKYLISELGCNPQIHDNNGLTPLHFASFQGHHKIVKFLISECNCNPECTDKYGSTPLHGACMNGNLEVAKYLVNEHKCDSDHGNINGFTPLHSAASNGHLAVMKYLITELGCNPQISSNDGLTPLHYAALNGHCDIVKFLRSDCNCDPPCCTKTGLTPLHFACQNGHFEVAKYLVKEHKCHPEHANTNGNTLLHSAASSDHLAVVKFVMSESGCNPQIRDNNGLTPLHYATFHGHHEIAKFLISECICNPECTDKLGNTPLHFACQNGHLEVAKYLITEHHCNPEPEIIIQNTPLHSAAINGHLAVVEYFIRKLGCNPQIADKHHLTPLHYACIGGHLSTVKFLISECNWNVECTDRHGTTQLQCACQNGQLEVAKQLMIEHKLNPERGCGSELGSTPLHCASAKGHLHIVRYFISELNCNPQCVDNCGTTPLHLACLNGHLDVVKYLVHEQKCYPRCANNNGATPLYCACEAGQLEMVKYLVTQCKCDPMCVIDDRNTPLYADKSAEDNGEYFQNIPKFLYIQVEDLVKSVQSKICGKGFTPLHVACSKGHLEVVKYLITECNCNPNSCNSFYTPLGCALVWKHFEVLHYLITECNCNSVFSPGILQQLCGESLLTPDKMGSICIKLDDVNSPLFFASCQGDLETVKVICNCNPLTKHSPLCMYVACNTGELEVFKFLLAFCDYSRIDTFLALRVACAIGQLDIIKFLIPQFSEKLSFLLFTSCQYGHFDTVKFLIEECGCDPKYTDDDGLTSLHYTCTDVCLIDEHVDGDQLGLESSVTNIKKQGIAFHIWQAIIYPIMLISQLVTRFKSPATIPGVANPDITLRIDHENRIQMEWRSHKIDIFKYLIVKQKCIVQCKDKGGRTPLHYACASGQLDIVQYTKREKLSDLVHTTHSGNTPLHIACKCSQEGITEFLLSTGECDPLRKNAEGMTPLEVATSVEIRECLDHFCKGNYTLESVVKVFILGDPLAGKSSLVQALQTNPGFISSLIGRLQRIKGVKQQTAGIDSLRVSSNDFGNVVIYDFAGQREFHTSHAAFLQNSSSQLAGIFIVVTNIAQCENDVCHSLQYWVSFILECCAHSEMKPHIIFVGSHEDQLNRGDIDEIHSLIDRTVFRKHDSHQYEPKDIVYLDCTRPVSAGLDRLRYNLEESCNFIRQQAGKIDQRCYVLHRHVQKMYIDPGVQGCNLESISKDLDGNSHLLPSNPTELLPLFQTLHDKGQVLLLGNNQNLGKSWVITDIAAVLENVTGTIFAPKDFPTHVSLGSTGVVAKSRIRDVFSNINTDMIIGFLEHFEFCHRVEPSWFNLPGLEQSYNEMMDDEYYLFPALVTSDRPLHERYGSSYCCGWLIHSVQDQFFTARFLHVLLLRLAFLFSQPQEDTTLSDTKAEAPAMRRGCKIWKNGIAWQDANGVSTFVEVRDLKRVVLSITCMEGSRIHCVRLRSQLIQTLLKSKYEFCPRVLTEEFIVEVADEGRLQVIDECPSCSINYLSSRISKRSANDNPDLTLLLNPDVGPGKQISKLLYFEPYALLTLDLIAKLFTKENAKQPVLDDFITELAKCMYPFHDALERVLKPSSSKLNKKFKDICDSLGEVSKQQLMCEHIIKTWVEQRQRSATYGKLKRELDRHGIFCGRNPLNLQTDESSDPSDDESESGDDKMESGSQGDHDQLSLMECVKMQGLNRRINLPLEIGTKYRIFGILLLEDRTGERVNAIAEKHMNDAEKTVVNILEEWISGRGKHPITWKTLTEILRDSELSVLAGEIEAVKHHTKTQWSEVRDDKPTLVECVRFRGRERRINITHEIGTKYLTFGTLLLEERGGERVSAIAHKHMCDPEQASIEILKEWIAGRGRQPVTWNTLIEVMYDIELSTLAREIEAVKLPADVEDRPIEVAEDSTQTTISDICARVTEDSDQRESGRILQNFQHESFEEEVSITEDLHSEAMLLELELSDADIEGSGREPAQDTEALMLELTSHNDQELSIKTLDTVVSKSESTLEPEQEDRDETDNKNTNSILIEDEGPD